MFARPEPHSFTKFVISAGVFLCIAAFVVPALVLRDTGVLTISKQELSDLTPSGRTELLRRQRVDANVARVAPFVGLALLLGGTALIFYGAPALRRQEQVEQARSSAELDKLRSEIRPQSESERRAGIKADLDQDVAEATTSPAIPTLIPEPRRSPDSDSYMDERLRRATEVEDAVLERIASITPHHYELHRNIMVADADGRLPLDALLISARTHLPDIVVEIKSRAQKSQFLPNPRPAVSDALLAVTRYRGRAGRPATGWLIYVIDEAYEQKTAKHMARFVKDLHKDLAITVVTEDGIPRLNFPSPQP